MNPDVWADKIESLYPLELALGEVRTLVQQLEASRSIVVNGPLAEQNESMKNLRATIVSQAVAGSSGSSDSTPASETANRKLVPSCNRINDIRQILRSSTAHI
jgi:hypothetical protein